MCHAGLLSCRFVEGVIPNDKMEIHDKLFYMSFNLYDNSFQASMKAVSRDFVIRKSYQRTLEEKEKCISTFKQDVAILQTSVDSMRIELEKSQRIDNDPDIIRKCQEISKMETDAQTWREVIDQVLDKLAMLQNTTKQEIIYRLRIPLHIRRLAHIE